MSDPAGMVTPSKVASCRETRGSAGSGPSQRSSSCTMPARMLGSCWAACEKLGPHEERPEEVAHRVRRGGGAHGEEQSDGRAHLVVVERVAVVLGRGQRGEDVVVARVDAAFGEQGRQLGGELARRGHRAVGIAREREHGVGPSAHVGLGRRRHAELAGDGEVGEDGAELGEEVALAAVREPVEHLVGERDECRLVEARDGARAERGRGHLAVHVVVVPVHADERGADDRLDRALVEVAAGEVLVVAEHLVHVVEAREEHGVHAVEPDRCHSVLGS